MGINLNLNTYLLTILLVISVFGSLNNVAGQRSLLHWRKDLEFRLNSYLSQRDAINNILASSIYPEPEKINGTVRVVSSENVRFFDLLIPTGSLILDSSIAQPSVRNLVNKTNNYVNSKMNDLDQVRNQLEVIKHQLQDPAQNFIYKGLPNIPTPQVNFSVIRGVREFTQFTYGHVIESNRAEVRFINFTNVDQVINEVYMKNTTIGLTDSQARLFFEGKKTFWRSVFTKELKSGCCDRLKPLHTSRMMLRSVPQQVSAPVYINNQGFNGDPVVIRQLATDQLYNRMLVARQETGELFAPTPPENIVQLHNLISTRQSNPLELLKTLVFKNVLRVDEAQLSRANSNRLVIGFLSGPVPYFDLSHDNYLLRFAASKDMGPIQRVSGPMIINSEALFVSNLDASSVNRIDHFHSFVNERIVRIDRPSVIRSSVRFNALPYVLNVPPAASSRPLQNVLIMHVDRGLEVGLVNGMRFPNDIVPLPLAPNKPIYVRGPRHFVNQVVFENFVQVGQLVNGLQMPAGVIPLHLNDFMGSVGTSNLWFVDGIVAHHVTSHSGQFDNIIMKDAATNDAQDVIMRAVFSTLPDGSHLIRAPLRITHVKIFNQPGTKYQGLLNGFRPQDIIELSNPRIESVEGRKTFLAPVEAIDCVFNDINHLTNWTNHLIRIDRPNTVQTVHTKLAFIQPPLMTDMAAPLPKVVYNRTSSVYIDQFRVEFYPNNNPHDYINNIKFSPEFYILHQALQKAIVNHTEGRYRVDQVNLVDPYGRPGRMNGVLLDDIVTLDSPFRFAGGFVMVGKVEVMNNVRANRITSNYPIDAMDLVQFDKYRIPIIDSRSPIRLNNLVLSTNNQASFVQCRMLNGISFNEFANSIMSLTRPQEVDSSLTFNGPVNLEGLVRTGASLNGMKQFKQIARNLKAAKYSFENGLQCNLVMIKV